MSFVLYYWRTVRYVPKTSKEQWILNNCNIWNTSLLIVTMVWNVTSVYDDVSLTWLYLLILSFFRFLIWQVCFEVRIMIVTYDSFQQYSLETVFTHAHTVCTHLNFINWLVSYEVIFRICTSDVFKKHAQWLSMNFSRILLNAINSILIGSPVDSFLNFASLVPKSASTREPRDH